MIAPMPVTGSLPYITLLYLRLVVGDRRAQHVERHHSGAIEVGIHGLRWNDHGRFVVGKADLGELAHGTFHDVVRTVPLAQDTVRESAGR
ncbi:hypothetical protein GCM10010399_05190 [Dactylosporangium fulvum]|uniref:Uncharacterized protein n=1 Tax=Dactylosporangium fulvum TaxID=53359 RepID=A0ABY5VUV0_9ACTN|nr:hypothetical protein [Dactylosporangium fulvum]UWP81370.1 hypothetical protein Dfulv_40640 [Dactylosporangium fulvum]